MRASARTPKPYPTLTTGCETLQVRTLESSYALELAKRQTAALRRAVDTYSTASLFVSARDGGWSVMHMNDCALRLAGAVDTVFTVRLLAGARPVRVRATVAGTSCSSVHVLEFLRLARMQGRASFWWRPKCLVCCRVRHNL